MSKVIVVGMIMALGTALASAQAYPSRTIRIITNEAGGPADVIARIIAQGIAGPLGQPVIVDNRSGTIVANEVVSKASPDGYTLLVAGSSLWIAPLLQKTPYDPARDFSPISLMVRSPQLLVVHPSLPAKSVEELIALAKAKPRSLNYSSAGPGSSNHLAAELFKNMAGVDMVHIPYKGAAPALNDLLGSHVQLMFAIANSATPHVKSGRLRALAVTTAEPSALFPGLPPVAAVLPGYEAVANNGIFAPAKSPEAVINRLNLEVVRVLNMADVKERLFNTGVEAVGSSPEELANKIRSEMSRMGKVIKDAGITAE